MYEYYLSSNVSAIVSSNIDQLYHIEGDVWIVSS